MEDPNKKVTEMFIKDLLDLYNRYVLLGMSKVDMVGVIINTLAGLYLTMTYELEEEDEDETIH
tara:strand:- start:388 stop:576 length:189 start_codon:yes stop_codon:yes gene_type:complete